MRSSATHNWRFAVRTDAPGTHEQNWRHKRYDAETKYTCREVAGGGLFRLTDLNGNAILLRRCVCAGSRHVLNEQSDQNAADLHTLKAQDYHDPRDRPVNPHGAGAGF